MVTVLFKNIGRNRLNWSARLHTLSEESVYNQARRRLPLQRLTVEFDDTGLAGIIYAEGRAAGSFQVQARP